MSKNNLPSFPAVGGAVVIIPAIMQASFGIPYFVGLVLLGILALIVYGIEIAKTPKE